MTIYHLLDSEDNYEYLSIEVEGNEKHNFLIK
jgi:hypothetical protein